MTRALGNDTTGLGTFETRPPHVVVNTEEKLTKYLDEFTSEFRALYISIQGRNLGKDGKIHAICIQAYTNKGQSQPTIAVVDVIALSNRAFTTVSGRDSLISLKFLLESSHHRKWFFDCRKASESLFNGFGITMSNVYSIQLLKNAVEIRNLRDDAAEIPKLLGKAQCVGEELALDEESRNRYCVIKNGVYSSLAEHTGPISDTLTDFILQDVTCLRKLHLALNRKVSQSDQVAIRLASNAQCQRFATVDIPYEEYTKSPFTRKTFMTVDELRCAAGSNMIDPKDLRRLNRLRNTQPQDQSLYDTGKSARRRRNRIRNRIRDQNNQAHNEIGLAQSSSDQNYGCNQNGFNHNGYSENGYNYNGYNHSYHGYNHNGYDHEGYNHNGYNHEGYNHEGYNHEGYNHNGYNHNGYNHNGYSENGFNHNGYSENGFNHNGYSENGFNHNGYNHNGYNQNNHQDYYQGGHHPNQQSYGPGNYIQNCNNYNEGQYPMASPPSLMHSHNSDQHHIQNDATLDISIAMSGCSLAMNQTNQQQAPLQPHQHDQQPAPALNTEQALMEARHAVDRAQTQASDRLRVLDRTNSEILNRITHLEQSDPPATEEEIIALAGTIIMRANVIMPEKKEFVPEMARGITTLEKLRVLEHQFAGHLT
ncbi:3 -5 exonuclease [Ophiostoma piceae UAMH 11346]|uniref:3-5 exonuclease n=1 Tax=Ophiostoma piceae (strain UAMH 11346) TaxID=1262450 RepID=S3C7F8_OPHP1|nr:3 -5 exonuclease [Ophiostoma piceae UAMH 11346]